MKKHPEDSNLTEETLTKFTYNITHQKYNAMSKLISLQKDFKFNISKKYARQCVTEIFLYEIDCYQLNKNYEE